MMVGPYEGEPSPGPAMKRPSRIWALLGFVAGFGIGWLAWARLVVPAITGTPTADNPSGAPADWIYYGSLLLCLVVALFLVSVIGEWIGSRRR